MTATQNSKVRGETRELLTVLRDILTTPPGEDPVIVRDRAVQASSVLDSLLTIEGATKATAITILRDRLAEMPTTDQP
jgi:hypothetical protein